MKSSTTQSSVHETSPSLRQTKNHHVLRYWTWELASLVTTVGLFAGIVTVLLKYDGQELPEWPYSININTLIALMSTVLRASMVFVVAEVIGQSKWAWFTDKPRPLQQLQSFDDASRGVWGSFSLIGLLRFGFRGSPLAMFAALITILSVAVGPFTQQAIKTVACPSSTGNHSATVPVANAVPGPGVYYLLDPDEWDVGVRMKGAMANGLTNPHGKDSTIEATCPTGNCTFPEINGVSHSTIGMCSMCMETTDFISRDKDMNYTLGDIWTRPVIPRNTWLGVETSSLLFAESAMSSDFRDVAQYAIVNISAMVLSASKCKQEHKDDDVDCDTAPFNPVAAGCTLYPCMKNFHAQVTDGRLEEKMISTQPAVVSGGAPRGPGYGEIWGVLSPDFIAVKNPCVIDEKLYEAGNFSLVPNITTQRVFADLEVDRKNVSVPSDCYYQVHTRYASALGSQIGDFLNGGCQATGGGPEVDLDCGEFWWLIDLYASGNATFETLETSFGDFVTVLTNFFRTDGWGPLNDTEYYNNILGPTDSRPPTPRKGQIEGQAIEMTVCMRLEWPWLLFPGALCLITILLLAAMLVINRLDQKQPVWKTSLLPLLFYGLDEKVERRFGGAGEEGNNLGRLGKEAAQTSVRFYAGTSETAPGFVTMDASRPEEHKGRMVEVDSLLNAGGTSSRSLTPGQRGSGRTVSPPARPIRTRQDDGWL